MQRWRARARADAISSSKRKMDRVPVSQFQKAACFGSGLTLTLIKKTSWFSALISVVVNVSHLLFQAVDTSGEFVRHFPKSLLFGFAAQLDGLLYFTQSRVPAFFGLEQCLNSSL